MIVAAALILSDPLSWIQWLGVICVFAGIPLAKVQRRNIPKDG